MLDDAAVRMAEQVLSDVENELRKEAGVPPKYKPHSLRYNVVMDIGTKDLDRRRRGDIVGLPWPIEWPGLSRRVGPIEPASLSIIAARPAIGKTIFGMQLARSLAAKGKRVLFVSRELSVVRLMRRNWTSYGASMMNLRKGDPSERDIAAIGAHASEAMDWELYIDDRSKSVEEFRQEAEALHPDIIIVDYLQRLAYDTEKEYAAITRIVNELQDLTLETEIPVVCLSQLSRPQKGYEWKVPSMSDTRGSGAVEERAANLIILHRFTEKNEGDDKSVCHTLSNNGWFVVSKCSDGESGEPISVVFNGARMSVQEKL